jgi:hypothetical protein
MRISSTLGFALFAGTLCALSSVVSTSEAAPDKAHGKHHEASSENAPASHHSQAPKAKDGKARSAHATPAAENKKTAAKDHKDQVAASKKPPKASKERPAEKPESASKDKPAAHHAEHASHADTKGRPAKTAKRGEDKPGRRPSTNPATCFHDPVSFVRGFDGDTDQIVLTRCSGQVLPGALDRLSVLGRPRGVAKPAATAADAKKHGAAHDKSGVQSLDSGLLTRLQAVALQFPGKSIHIVSASRPQSNGSYHQSGHAIDLVVRGVANEEVVAFCRTLPNTGCGYYPNSSFVHIDSRPAGTGHVYWIDASRPGEAARYVSAWPEPAPSSEQANHHHEGAPDGDEAHLPLDFAGSSEEGTNHSANTAPSSHSGTTKHEQEHSAHSHH